MKKKLIISTFILLTSLLYSEDKSSVLLPHYIGAGAGFATGYGLSYRHWPENLGAQVIFSPYTDGSDININLGFAGLKTLHQTEYTRLFLYLAANGTYSSYSSEEEWDEETEEYVPIDSVTETSIDITAGIGPGIELYIFRNIVIDLMFGYKYSFSGDMSGLGFTGECGIYYRF